MLKVLEITVLILRVLAALYLQSVVDHQTYKILPSLTLFSSSWSLDICKGQNSIIKRDEKLLSCREGSGPNEEILMEDWKFKKFLHGTNPTKKIRPKMQILKVGKRERGRGNCESHFFNYFSR